MIIIQNDNWAKYVMFKLDKIENSFTKSELASLEELVINPIDSINETTPIDLNLLVYFTGLKRLEIADLNINNNDIQNLQTLPNLKALTFENCFFEDIQKLTTLNIQELALYNCRQNIDCVYTMNLQSLSVLNNTIDIQKLNTMQNLKYLQISYCDVVENQKINLVNLQELYIDNTNINDLSFVKNITNLKKLSITQEQCNQNLQLVKDLIKNNITVMQENMVNFKDLEGYYE